MIAVAVVGLGWWGQHLLRILGAPGSSLQVVATVDPDPAKGSTHRTLSEVLALAEVDAVVLCTPHSTHHAQILECAAAGKHVFCEKPLALTSVDASSAVAACREAGLVLGIGHERRFEPGMQRVKELVQGRSLGEIMHAEAAFSHDKFRGLEATSWRGMAADAPAAGMTGMGVHLTDAFTWMLGPIAEVHAYVARRVLPLESGDVVSVHLRFESGATGAFSAVSATPFFARYAVFGSEAWVENREIRHPEEGTETESILVPREGGSTRRQFPRMDPTLANLNAFADAVGGGEPYLFTDAELVHNVAVLEAIVASAASGSPAAVRSS